MGKGNEGNRETAVGNVGLLMNFKHIDKRMRFRKRKNRSNIRKRYCMVKRKEVRRQVGFRCKVVMLGLWGGVGSSEWE